MLEPLGLDRVADLVYRAMLDNPGSDVSELARKLELDQATVRAALDRLADMSFLRPSPQEPDNWKVVNPKVALTTLLAEREADIHYQMKELERSRSLVEVVLSELNEERANADHAGFERIQGSDAVRSRLEELALDTREEVLCFAPGGPQRAEVLAASRPLDEATLARGVRMRTVFLDSIRNHAATARYARWMVDNGAQVRTALVLPLRMIIADRSVAVIPVDPLNGAEGAHVVASPGGITALLALFEHVWNSATPLHDREQVQEHDTAQLTAQQRELVRLLSQGHTDEVAARHLGVSLRTVRRIMAEVMTRIDARSRFQAGVRLARLDLPDGK